ncbi:hypothetical protein Goklo_019851 [Gossypium klotzschianum]|uniref:Uncharacterized protein n=1 Tax=Gossypium klotzschianum TaxID=34286 RepID=A0A7J8UQA5_9ROSI|nr:hypothetical protein [Gossypium klotzschianum]
MSGYNKDIVIMDGDFATRTIDEVCSIKFSERVHKLIEISIERTMDIVIVDGDFATRTIDEVCSIKFSERVHKLIEISIERMMVVKLLGTGTEFNALYNHIYAL